MKLPAIAAVLLVAGFAPALAQTQPAPPAPYSTVFPPGSHTGQEANGVNPSAFYANTDTAGFAPSSLSSIAATGTNQATAADLLARTNIITACPAGAGVQLPNIDRSMVITVLNRSGAACLVYPTPNGAVESAPGTMGAVNAAASIANGADANFRLVSPTAWMQ